ncbi:MAG: hypothetical protein LBD99_02550 [Candidatus Margulisbacteria bacterium]|nr:hypothetical protein [Candidatus Margulisiibacteriota bacterium]
MINGINSVAPTYNSYSSSGVNNSTNYYSAQPTAGSVGSSTGGHPPGCQCPICTGQMALTIETPGSSSSSVSYSSSVTYAYNSAAAYDAGGAPANAPVQPQSAAVNRQTSAPSPGAGTARAVTVAAPAGNARAAETTNSVRSNGNNNEGQKEPVMAKSVSIPTPERAAGKAEIRNEQNNYALNNTLLSKPKAQDEGQNNLSVNQAKSADKSGTNTVLAAQKQSLAQSSDGHSTASAGKGASSTNTGHSSAARTDTGASSSLSNSSNVSSAAQQPASAVSYSALTGGTTAVNNASAAQSASGQTAAAGTSGSPVMTQTAPAAPAIAAGSQAALSGALSLASSGKELTAGLMNIIQGQNSKAMPQAAPAAPNIGGGEKIMQKPAQIQLAFSTLSGEKTTLTGKNGEKMVFGDIKSDGKTERSQPIISFSVLSRIAHERDVQKENLSKLLGLLFGRYKKLEETDEDLEGLYGVWSDYIKQQKEKQEQQKRGQQRQKEKKEETKEEELVTA